MVDGGVVHGVVQSHGGVGSRPDGEGSASLSLQAGLVGLLCVFVLLATFGPWFNLAVAYGLAAAAAVAGACGLVWAHTASHRLGRHRSRAGVRAARLGGLTSAIAVGVSAYLTGVSIGFLNPAIFVVCLSLLVVFLVLHFRPARVEGESA